MTRYEYITILPFYKRKDWLTAWSIGVVSGSLIVYLISFIHAMIVLSSIPK